MAQHFLLSAQARTLSLKAIYKAGEDKAYDQFKAIRWASTGGEPVCPRCGLPRYLFDHQPPPLQVRCLLSPVLGDERHDLPFPQDGFHRSSRRNRVIRERGYPLSMINGYDNLVRIPQYRHERISDWYSTGNKRFGGMTPRAYLRGRNWEERFQLGLERLREEGLLK